MFGLDDGSAAALIGLATGLVLGLAARLGRFCTLGAIEDALYQNSTLRLRMWAAAIGAAVVLTFALIGVGLLDPAETQYLGLGWNIAGAVLGGLTFGYGMALAGNCGFGALARLGGGDLRSFVIVVVLGLSAYATLSGPLARLRVWAFPAPRPDAPPGIAHWISGVTGLSSTILGIAMGVAILAAAWASREAFARPGRMAWGLAVGASVAGGFGLTAWLREETLSGVPVTSHSFAAPVGEAMLWAMTASGTALTFGTGSVAGVLLGAFLGSLRKGRFRWEACDDPRELRRQIAGAALMGVGAVVAQGCTIGQGISAFALLAFSAPVTLAAIFAGAALGLRQLITGFAEA